jgi:hypothetical protein
VGHFSIAPQKNLAGESQSWAILRLRLKKISPGESQSAIHPRQFSVSRVLTGSAATPISK